MKPTITYTVKQLRKMPLDQLPNEPLMGVFPLEGSIIERAARVGQLLRNKVSEGFKIVLVIDDDKPIPVGWKYAACTIKKGRP